MSLLNLSFSTTACSKRKGRLTRRPAESKQGLGQRRERLMGTRIIQSLLAMSKGSQTRHQGRFRLRQGPATTVQHMKS